MGHRIQDDDGPDNICTRPPEADPMSLSIIWPPHFTQTRSIDRLGRARCAQYIFVHIARLLLNSDWTHELQFSSRTSCMQMKATQHGHFRYNLSVWAFSKKLPGGSVPGNALNRLKYEYTPGHEHRNKQQPHNLQYYNIHNQSTTMLNI